MKFPSPDKLLIGNCNNEPVKLEIYFDDLLVHGIQKDWSSKVKKQKKKEQRQGTQDRTSARSSSGDHF